MKATFADGWIVATYNVMKRREFWRMHKVYVFATFKEINICTLPCIQNKTKHYLFQTIIKKNDYVNASQMHAEFKDVIGSS